MRKLSKPSFTQEEILESCVSNMTDASLVATLLSKSSEFTDAYNLYEEYSNENNLHLIAENYSISDIKKDVLRDLYTNKLSKYMQPARVYYNQLMALSLDFMCTACGYRPADSLDHVLAKTKFPAFSINPLNLVPMCIACNKKKSSQKSNGKTQNAIHPYYDDIDQIFWLKANITEKFPFEIEFKVDLHCCEDSELLQRISNHFDDFALNKLYKIYASTEISEIIYDLKEMFNSSSLDDLKDDLNRTKQKCARNYNNTWRFAFYQELSTNEWFLNEMLSFDIDTILKNETTVSA